MTDLPRIDHLNVTNSMIIALCTFSHVQVVVIAQQKQQHPAIKDVSFWIDSLVLFNMDIWRLRLNHDVKI